MLPIPVHLQNFVVEYNSRTGTTTRVTSAGMTFCNGIMRENWSELVPVQKVAPISCEPPP